jgi:hypothetical protein
VGTFEQVRSWDGVLDDLGRCVGKEPLGELVKKPCAFDGKPRG